MLLQRTIHVPLSRSKFVAAIALTIVFGITSVHLVRTRKLKIATDVVEMYDELGNLKRS